MKILGSTPGVCVLHYIQIHQENSTSECHIVCSSIRMVGHVFD